MRSVLLSFRAVLAFAVAALVAGAVMLVAPSSASAAPTPDPAGTSESAGAERTLQRAASCNWRRKRCFGSAAVNRITGTIDFANDKRTKTAAKTVAMRKCRNNPNNDGVGRACRSAGWVRNGCLAVAARIRNSTIVEWAAAVAYNADPAYRKAKDKVRGPGREVKWGHVCTTRRK